MTSPQTVRPEGPPTSWTLVEHAAGTDAAATHALSEFTCRYYAGIRAFIRVIVGDADLAEDLTQEFFHRRVLQDRRVLLSADRSKGRFRPYLKQSIRNFLVDKRREAARSPQGDPRFSATPALWDTLRDDGMETADKALLREWGQSIVNLALERVKQTAEARQQHEHFAMFAKCYLEDPDHRPGFREIGRMFDLDEKAARGRIQTIVNQFRVQLQEILKSDAGTGKDVDQEIRSLMALL